MWGAGDSNQYTTTGPFNVYIGPSEWFMMPNSALCAANLTTLDSRKSVLAMWNQTVTDALYVTVAKYISIAAKHFIYAEIQPLRMGG